MTEKVHLYERRLDTRSSASLVRLATHILQAPGDILDLGMGPGSLGRYLRTGLHRSVTLDGVTHKEEEESQAAGFYHHCWIADVESVDLLALVGKRRYRWVVCGDVLEHLRNPEALLVQCRALLTDCGELLVSIPNASYAGLIADLIHGQWQYRPEGLLDRTHVRFFTRQSFIKTLTECGWHAISAEPIKQPWHETEFSRPFDNLPPAVGKYLLAQPHTLAYQWIIRAAPADRPDLPTLRESIDNDDASMASYVISLYIDDGTGFSERHRMCALGTMGRSCQEIKFTIDANTRCERLRLDPADRPGYWNLRRITLTDRAQNLLWEWKPSKTAHLQLQKTEHYDIHIGSLESGSAPFSRMILTGSDPQFTLPIPPEIVRSWGALGGTLTITCDWPWSPDYHAAIEAIKGTDPSSAPSINDKKENRHKHLGFKGWARNLLFGKPRIG